MKDYFSPGVIMPDLTNKNIDIYTLFNRESPVSGYWGFKDLVTLGIVIIADTLFVKFDVRDYKGDNPYIVKLSDLKEIDKINNKNNNMKEIIGYKSPMQIGKYTKGELYINYKTNKDLYIPASTENQSGQAFYSIPKEIVEQWEPVYSPSEIIMRIGGDIAGFDLKIKKDGIYHKEHNIKNYVEDIVKKGGEQFIGLFSCDIKEIIFSKTGCENVETKLSEWIKVWNKYTVLKNE